MELKLDLHVHSYFSADSAITPHDLVFYCKKRGLDGVGLTDHGTVTGALKIADEADLLVIPGIEVSTQQGHVTALNVRTNIPNGLTAEKTIDRIHEAGGIAVACHPFGFLKGGLGRNITSQFDGVEVINASAFPFDRSVRLGVRMAERCGIASRVGGSDAHFGPEIGYAYTSVTADSSDRKHVVEAIRKGVCTPLGDPIPIWLRLEKQIMVRLGRRREKPG